MPSETFFLDFLRTRVVVLPVDDLTIISSYYFFREAAARRGPLRVRAFVLVRWPCTGRPRLCLVPRYVPKSISLLIESCISRRRSPSTLIEATCSRTRSSSASVRSLTFLVRGIWAFSQILRARARPMPKMVVRPISACCCGGMLNPAMRAIIIPWTICWHFYKQTFNLDAACGEGQCKEYVLLGVFLSLYNYGRYA